MSAGAASVGRRRLQGAGLDLALPYLLLAPCVLIVLLVLVYPLWDGLRASTQLYRYGKAVGDVGFANYARLWMPADWLPIASAIRTSISAPPASWIRFSRAHGLAIFRSSNRTSWS